MKIVAIGDTHGRAKWKEVISKEGDFDKLIFIGDYFDSREGIPFQTQMANFLDIVEYKSVNPDKVILLTGNHEWHYFPAAHEKYSQYQAFNRKTIGSIIEPLRLDGTLQMCYLHDKYLFSHAGVTKTWAESAGIDLNNIERSINNLFKEDIEPFNFTMGDNYSRSGDDITQPPLWVRPASLLEDRVEEYVHVVGHTTVKHLDYTYKEQAIFIDTIGYSGQYLIINDGKLKTGDLEDEN